MKRHVKSQNDQCIICGEFIVGSKIVARTWKNRAGIQSLFYACT